MPDEGFPPADGKTVSHEAIYRLIYALPKGELAKLGVLLRSKRTRRRRPRHAGERGAPIVGMRSIDDDVVAAATIDRLVHHAHVIPLDGDSYRTRAHRTKTPPPASSRTTK